MRTKPLLETVAAIINEQKENTDYTTTYGDLFNGIKQNGVVVFDDGKNKYEVPKGVYKNLLNNIGASSSIVNDRDVSEATRVSYINDKLRKGWGDKEIVVRASGNALDGVVSTKYNYIDNTTLVEEIAKLSNEGLLPPFDDLRVSGFNMSKGARNISMRIMAPDHWTFQNGDTYYGGVLVKNNEIGEGAVAIQPAVARVSCFNFTIGEDTFSVPHRDTVSIEEVQNALRMGFGQITMYAERMFEQIQQTKSISIENPKVIFEAVKQQMRLPNYVFDKAMEYYEAEGSGETLFDINQALTFGTQELTDTTGRRRKVRFEERDAIEQDIWSWTQDLLNIHNEGGDVNNITSQYELLGKRKAIVALEQMGYGDAAGFVEGLEPDDYVF